VGRHLKDIWFYCFRECFLNQESPFLSVLKPYLCRSASLSASVWLTISSESIDGANADGP
jgi:hypothetical protein